MVDIEFTAEEDEGEESGEYTPEPAIVYGDSFVIFDQDEFAAEFNCHGALMYEGSLFVLDRESKTLRMIELDKGKPANKLSRVQ